MKIKSKSIYLDVCTLCRPFDEQNYLRIHMETEAVKLILSKLKDGKMRNECLDVNICGTVLEADFVIREWVRFYNTIRPHSSLGYKPPAPETIFSNYFGKADLCLSLN